MMLSSGTVLRPIQWVSIPAPTIDTRIGCAAFKKIEIARDASVLKIEAVRAIRIEAKRLAGDAIGDE